MIVLPKLAAAAISMTLALTAAASAQAPYPNRNITLVLPFAPGSGTDTTTRLIGKELGVALGVNTVIDNKAGANGSIAASYVARSAPDGYTLFVTTNTTHSANPYLLKTMSYDPVKDFTPIARTGDLPFMLVINPEIPANSVAELIALAKKEPGKVTIGSPPPPTLNYFGAEQFKAMTGSFSTTCMTANTFQVAPPADNPTPLAE